jgi:phage tail tape-measure protein
LERNLKTKYELVLTSDGRLLVKTADGLEDIGDQAERAESKVERLNRKLDAAAAKADRIASGAGKFARFSAAVAVGLGTVVYKAVQAAAEIEAAHTQLLTIFRGNAKLADETMEWIKRFAATTPFELRALTNATVRLEAYGLSARKWLPLVGDLAAAMGRDVTETAVAIGKAVASGGAGMDALRESYAITSEQLKQLGWNGKTGAEGIESFSAALTQALKEGRTAGGMERLSQTLEGAVSNIKDMLYQLSADVGAPLLQIIKEDLQDILKRVEEMKRTGEWDRWIKKISDFFTKFYEGAKKTLKWVGELVKHFVEFLDKNPKFAEFIVKLATIGPLAGKATQGIARLAGGVMRLASNIMRSTGSGGALTKLGGWAMRTSGAVSAVDPSKATGAAGSSAVGRAGSARGGVAGAGLLAGLGATAAIAAAGVAIRGIVKAVDDLVISEEELARGRAASDELHQTLLGIQHRQAQREVNTNRIIAAARDNMVDKLGAEAKIATELAEQEERRLAAMERQAAVQGAISGANADLNTAMGQLRSILEGGFFDKGGFGLQVQMATGQSIDQLMQRVEMMSKTGDVMGIERLREQLSGIEQIVGNDSWEQFSQYLGQAALAGEQLNDAMREAGRQSEFIVKLNEASADHLSRYTALMDRAAQLSGDDRDVANDKLDTVRQLLVAEKNKLLSLVDQLGAQRQQLLAMEDQLRVAYKIADMQGLDTASTLVDLAEEAHSRAGDIQGRIEGINTSVGNIDQALDYTPVTTDRGDATSPSGGSGGGGSAGGAKGPAIQYVTNNYTAHIREALLTAPEGATTDTLVRLLSRIAEQGEVSITEEG